jgi:hypothetical protein
VVPPSSLGVVTRKLILDLVRLEFGQANGQMAVVHRGAFALPIPDHQAPIALSDHEAGKRWFVGQGIGLRFIDAIQWLEA